MSFSTMRSLIALGVLAGNAIQLVFAQSLTPLASKSFPFTSLPTQAAGANAGPRGPQAGFNNCSNSTASDTSMCQTLVVNSPTDFCIWGTPGKNETIADTEAAEVAYCTSPERGGRPINAGTITGVQWLYAKDYIQLVAYLDQTAVGLAADDEGGELDEFGADGQGNPLGSLVYSNSFNKGFNSAMFDQQLKSGVLITSDQEENLPYWVEFIGNGLICMKICTNKDPNRADLCNHIYDEIGCAYNAIAQYSTINGSYTVCDSDDMTPPGFYTLSDGSTTQWVQPFTGSFTVPYTPTQVASSNCFTYESTQLFPVSATPTGSAGAGAATTTGASGGAGSTGSKSGSAGGPAATGGSGANAAVGVYAAPITVIVGAMLGAFITVFA